MTYQKPEVVILASALDAIQGTSKCGSVNDASIHPTVGAYEADE